VVGEPTLGGPLNRKRYLTLLLPFLSVVFCVLAAEAILRFYHFMTWDISLIDGQPRKMGGLSPIIMDAELGWRATENYQYEGTRNSFDGKPYAVKISQNRHGFRMFGQHSSGKPRVFVIGDSFTQATAVSDEKTYYAVLSRLLDVEVFAYGGGGYGTLQEWLIFDRYFDSLKPDLVLWQFSTNDFINNSPELETASRINNNGMIRPYWVNHGIDYILPKQTMVNLRLFALQYCRICYVALSRLDRLFADKLKATVETETSPGGSADTAFRASVDITAEIMRMARRRAGSIPIVGFIVGLGQPYGPEYEAGFKEISHRLKIFLLDDVEPAVLAAEQKGIVVRAEDGAHWNESGHRIAGEAIAAGLTKSCLLNLCRSMRSVMPDAPTASTSH
jgi:lysophospholipase L1-like esterase